MEDLVDFVTRQLGDRVRRFRTERELAVPDLAAEVPCTVPTVYNVENGRFPPSLRTLCRLSEVLDVDLLDFFCWPTTRKLRHEVIELTREAPAEVLREVKALLEKRAAASSEPPKSRRAPR